MVVSSRVGQHLQMAKAYKDILPQTIAASGGSASMRLRPQRLALIIRREPDARWAAIRREHGSRLASTASTCVARSHARPWPCPVFLERELDRLLALQLLFLKASESMGNHDSEIVDAGSVD